MHDPLSEKVEKLSIGMGKRKYYSKLGLKKKKAHILFSFHIFRHSLTVNNLHMLQNILTSTFPL